MNKSHSKKIMSLWMLCSMILSFSLLLAGCSNAQGSGQMQDSVVVNSTVEDQEPSELDSENVEIESASSKPEQVKQQEQLSQLIADGVHQTQKTYEYHSGSETVNISISTENDVVVAASVIGNNPHKVSAKYIDGVNDALPDLVVGKRIDEIEMPKQVSGSSLTTGVVKQYLDELKTPASS